MSRFLTCKIRFPVSVDFCEKSLLGCTELATP
jgi:hypothetical protein